MSVTAINPFDDMKLWNNVIAYNILSKLPTELMNKVVDYVPKPIFKKKQEFKAGLYKLSKRVKFNFTKNGVYTHPIHNDYKKDKVSFNEVIFVENLENPIVDSYHKYEAKETTKQFKITHTAECGGHGFEENFILSKNKFEQKEGYKYYKYRNVEWIWIEEDCDNKDLVLPWREYFNWDDTPHKSIKFDEEYYTKYYENYNFSA